MNLIAKAAANVLVRRARKSLTAWIGAAVAGGGAAAAIDPTLLEAIPESLRGYAMGVVGVAVIFSRHRREILAVWEDLKALRR